MFRQAVVITFLLSLQVLVGASSSLTEEDDDRIIGGKSVSIEQFPYQASIQYDGYHFCGGSLLNNKTVLTAAHCVESLASKDISHLRIVVGTSTYAVGGQRIPVASFAKHPWYNPKNLTYDVALISMKSAATFSKSVQPIVMADKVPKDGSLVVVSGWGYLKNNATTSSPDLQAAEINFFTRSSCTKEPNWYTEDYISNTMVCAGADGKNSCKGDSGGPLMEVETNKLVGVVSWGFECAQKGYPTVYSSVPVLKTWIENTIKKFSKA